MLSSRAHQITLDTPYFPTKTPSRGFKRTENAGARTIGPKGKALLLQTPFGDSKTRLKGGFATTGKPRPLLDKTPFPNRVQQQKQQDGKDGLGKLPKLVLVETERHATPETLRPSSTRKHARLPRISGSNFQTPVNQGNHWDVGDISLELAEPQVQDTVSEDDHDEIEYMAPNTLDLPYQPPFDFDLPDYKSIGRDFRKTIFSPAFDDVAPQLADLDEIKPLPESWSFMPLKDIDDDDDPFRQPEPKATVAPKAVPAPGKRTLASQIRRPASAIPPASTATSTSKAKITRPATSLATKPPAVAAPRRAVSKPVVTLPMRNFSTTAIKTSSSARATSSTSAAAQRPGSRSVVPKISTQSKAKSAAAAKSYPDLLIFANEVIEDDFFFDV